MDGIRAEASKAALVPRIPGKFIPSLLFIFPFPEELPFFSRNRELNAN